MQDNLLSIGDLAEWVWKTIFGTVTAIIGYFLPIKDLVHLVILFFLVDMLFGYWAARKLRGEKFSTRIVWRTTFPRMLISLVLIIMAYLWDTTCNQTYLPTYNIIGWFISGILLFSIGKNAFKITNWEGFKLLSLMFKKKIKDQTGIDPKILIIAFLLLTSVYAEAQTITYLKVADKPEYAKYLEYCNTPVPRTFFMTGAVTLLKTNNYYVQPNGDWMAKLPLTIKWYPFGTKSFTFEAYQKEIIARVEIMVPRRYPPSIDDFYKNWKTGNIQDGLVDSKTCGLWPGL